MLIATNLHKIFHQGIDNKVINGIDLSIKEKEFVVITGKSGSGKSTLLYLLSGLETPTEGSVVFKGNDVGKMNDTEISRLRRNSFGFIFQFYNLVASLNVRDNIFLPIDIERKITSAEKEEVLTYAKEIGVADKLKSFPHQLSGGEQQRVSIVRALAINPDIIFADEPTGNLDSATREEVLNVFYNLNKKHGKTIVMVTHDDSVGSRFATRELHIENGKII